MSDDIAGATLAQWVDVHAISHRSRGKDSRGKFLRDRWTLHFKDKDGKEGSRLMYSESQDVFDSCGLDFEWPHNKRLELPAPIPVQLDSEYKPVKVGQVEH